MILDRGLPENVFNLKSYCWDVWFSKWGKYKFLCFFFKTVMFIFISFAFLGSSLLFASWTQKSSVLELKSVRGSIFYVLFALKRLNLSNSLYTFGCSSGLLLALLEQNSFYGFSFGACLGIIIPIPEFSVYFDAEPFSFFFFNIYYIIF